MEMNLPELVEQFGSEEKCRDYLEELRWPNGVECLRCQSKKISRLKKREQYECSDCRYQFSVRVGTLFHDSHLPLWKWFLAIYLITESKKGISANQLKRMLNVSYKTAWYLSHRIRSAMGDREHAPLSGIVEMDETYIGGKQSNRHKSERPKTGKRGGDGSWRKRSTMVVGAVERGGEVRLRVEKHGDAATLYTFMNDHVADECRAIYTDENNAYFGFADDNTRHETVRHAADEWVRGDVHTQTMESVWSLFKRSIIGSYHQLSVKHLPAYLDEFEFRFNNRDNAFLFRDTVLALVRGDSLTYRELVDRR